MKTFILNGSPRKNGNTSVLINKMREFLIGEVLMFSAYYDNIKPCINCNRCIEDKTCNINDDMQKIYRCAYSFDNVVIASPVYFGLPTGQLLNILSRFQFCFMGQGSRKFPVYGKPKRGAVILTAGGTSTTEEAERVVATMLRLMNASPVGKVISANTDILPAANDTEALLQAEKIARKFSYKN